MRSRENDELLRPSVGGHETSSFGQRRAGQAQAAGGGVQMEESRGRQRSSGAPGKVESSARVPEEKKTGKRGSHWREEMAETPEE